MKEEKTLGRPRLDLPIEEIVALDKEGKSKPYIANKYNVTVRTIILRLEEYYNSLDNKPSIDQIVFLYEHGSSAKQIAKQCHIPLNEVREILRNVYVKNNAATRKLINVLKKLGYSNEDIEKVINKKNISIEDDERERVEI